MQKEKNNKYLKTLRMRLGTAVNSRAWALKNHELNKVAHVSSMAQGSCWSASHLYVLNSEKEERKKTSCSSNDPSWNAVHLKCMSMSHTSSLLHLVEGDWGSRLCSEDTCNMWISTTRKKLDTRAISTTGLYLGLKLLARKSPSEMTLLFTSFSPPFRSPTKTTCS